MLIYKCLSVSLFFDKKFQNILPKFINEDDEIKSLLSNDEVIKDDILYNTMQRIKHDKQVLLENNFYDKSTDKDIIQMKAREYLEEHIGEIIIKYKNNE